MLFIPVATKSLINDGMEGASSAMAAVPIAALAGGLKGKAMSMVKSGGRKTIDSVDFMTRPLTNPVTGRAKVIAEKYGEKFNEMKSGYASLGLPESYKNMESSKIPLRRSNFDSKEKFFKAVDSQIQKEFRNADKSVDSSK